MSCDGNRHRYLSFMENQHGMNARHLEMLYQRHKARGPQSPEEEVVQSHKTRQLFLAMQKEGIKPPTVFQDLLLEVVMPLSMMRSR
jgi:hypothetical protein